MDTRDDRLEGAGRNLGGVPDDAQYEFVPIFRGSQSEMVALRSLLEGQGFHTHVEAEFIKTLDPFITGGNVFEVELQVPRGELEEASRCVAECRAEASRTPAESIHAGDPVVSPGRIPAAVFGRRLRWGLILCLCFQPMGLLSPVAGAVFCGVYWIFGAEYLLRVRSEGQRPSQHGLTLACLAMATLVFAITLIVHLQLP